MCVRVLLPVRAGCLMFCAYWVVSQGCPVHISIYAAPVRRTAGGIIACSADVGTFTNAILRARQPRGQFGSSRVRDTRIRQLTTSASEGWQLFPFVKEVDPCRQRCSLSGS
jgi:hypothetical protein